MGGNVGEEVPYIVENLFLAFEKKVGKNVVGVRFDRAMEYMCDYLASFYKKKGIEYEATPLYSPESNGRAERLNRTLLEKARSILEELHVLTGMKVYKKLWTEAVYTVVHVHKKDSDRFNA